jgi:hypothetical protein
VLLLFLLLRLLLRLLLLLFFFSGNLFTPCMDSRNSSRCWAIFQWEEAPPCCRSTSTIVFAMPSMSQSHSICFSPSTYPSWLLNSFSLSCVCVCVCVLCFRRVLPALLSLPHWSSLFSSTHSHLTLPPLHSLHAPHLFALSQRWHGSPVGRAVLRLVGQWHRA